MSFIEKSQQLRELATEVRNNVYAREAIAKALDLIACAMIPCEGCEDCGSTQPGAVIAENTLHQADNPEAGQDVATAASEVIATTEQALVGDQAEDSNTGV